MLISYLNFLYSIHLVGYLMQVTNTSSTSSIISNGEQELSILLNPIRGANCNEQATQKEIT